MVNLLFHVIMPLSFYTMIPPRLLRKHRNCTRMFSVDIQRASRIKEVNPMKSASWTRLKNLVELCLAVPHVTSVADIGCDHGILTGSLALTGKFQKIVGVDVSERALSAGARLLETKMRQKNDQSFEEALSRLEFRIGDGLSSLAVGEADTVCISGMGAATMSRILDAGTLESLQTRHLVLQPTFTRPGNLISLYEYLFSIGWIPSQETVAYLDKRWYLSTSFTPISVGSWEAENGTILPMNSVLKDKTEKDLMVAIEYIQHHCRWLENDAMHSPLRNGEEKWLQAFKSILVQ